uniref:NADH dehydrogenase subunit 4 n=1 Tax=Cruznema tripartitum TaxID=53474 RepID=UPI0023D7BB64|nr:NADH dehydrogenase subunit 4 [Cruznema tripartitum]WCR50924.1 NADH dehydrogenase subunit 4 [Cruznema tripartitum]
MLEYFFLGLMFLFKPFFFFVFFTIFSFMILNNLSWSGIFILSDSYVFVLMVVLSMFIFGVIMISEKNNNLLLLSEILIIFCILFFVPSNMMLMYMFFELSMFPILIMILGFGSQIEKINSSYYLLVYAAFCSMPFLYIFFVFNSNNNIITYFDENMGFLFSLVLSLSFMVKFPIYFLHLWLPKAHVEAPTSASMLLAGLLLKLGTAGFLRIMKTLNMIHINFWLILSFIGMILAAFCCIFQSDSKSLAAYSSVTHMSFLFLGILIFNLFGKSSSVMLMLAHGYTSTLMFYFIGEFYHMSSTRMIYFMNSFFNSSMILGILFSLVFLSNAGSPPSLSFFSELMIIAGSFVLVKFMFVMLFVYFMVAFYYSIFLITNSLMGKDILEFSNWNVGFSLPLVLMMFNIFWLSLLY